MFILTEQTDTETDTKKFMDFDHGFSTHSVYQAQCEYIATFFSVSGSV